MRIDIALVDVAPLGVDTPEDLRRARANAGAEGKAMTEAKTIAYQGEPGANSHIACLDNYPDHRAARPAPLSRTRSPRCRTERPISA